MLVAEGGCLYDMFTFRNLRRRPTMAQPAIANATVRQLYLRSNHIQQSIIWDEETSTRTFNGAHTDFSQPLNNVVTLYTWLFKFMWEVDPLN